MEPANLTHTVRGQVRRNLEGIDHLLNADGKKRGVSSHVSHHASAQHVPLHDPFAVAQVNRLRVGISKYIAFVLPLWNDALGIDTNERGEEATFGDECRGRVNYATQCFAISRRMGCCSN